MIRHHLLIAFLFSTSSLAAGNVYAVMPTQGVGAAAEAALVWQTMRLALEEQSLALVPRWRWRAISILCRGSC